MKFRKEVTTTSTPKAKSRKKQYKRSCDICGKECKGAMGLGIHKAKSHQTDYLGPISPVAHQSKETRIPVTSTQ